MRGFVRRETRRPLGGTGGAWHAANRATSAHPADAGGISPTVTATPIRRTIRTGRTHYPYWSNACSIWWLGGSNSHDRDLRLARTTYIGAVRRFDAALRRFDARDIPTDPGPGRGPRAWTADHVAIVRELVQAVTAVWIAGVNGIGCGGSGFPRVDGVGLVAAVGAVGEWEQQNVPRLLAKPGFSRKKVELARRWFNGRTASWQFFPTLMGHPVAGPTTSQIKIRIGGLTRHIPAPPRITSCSFSALPSSSQTWAMIASGVEILPGFLGPVTA